jgi:Domain of unknown function (DUF6089)
MKRFLLSVAILLPYCVPAQDHHEFGITAGVANYHGDLQDKIFPNYGYMPMAGIIYKYFMSPHVGLRFGASYATVTAADSLSDIPADRARNLSFTTHILELHGALEVNILPIEVRKMKVSPYLFGGISVFYFNPFAQDPNGNKVYLRPLSTEGEGLPQYPDRKEYSLVNAAFPFGGGIKFFIGKTLMLSGELGFRYTNTDYLDDVSKTYVSLDTLAAYKGKLAAQMSFRGNAAPGWSENPIYPTDGTQRGDSKANDWYWFGNVTVTVYFRAFGNVKQYVKTRCPNIF